MKITSSYAVEIKKQRMFDDTIKLYREAVSFLIDCFNKEWPAIQAVDKAKAKFNFAEKLIHHEILVALPKECSYSRKEVRKVFPALCLRGRGKAL